MASEPDYVFTRDYLDNNRINLQHYLWTEVFGYLTHPRIPIDDRQLRVADVGTGTGIWLTQLGAALPATVRLDGLDVSWEAVPPAGCLPANVRLMRWNVLEPVLEHLLDVYDVVHISSFSFVLRDGEVLQVAARLVELLKPGGFLQWGEPDVASFRIERPSPRVATEALTRLLALTQPQDGRLSPQWVPGLSAQLLAAGLEVVDEDVREAPPYLAWTTHQCSLMMHELLSRQTGNVDVARALRALMPAVVSETRQGAYWAFTRYVVVGRKRRGDDDDDDEKEGDREGEEKKHREKGL